MFLAMPFLHFMPFFWNLLLRFPTVFQEFPSCNFLIFPRVSSIFLGFSKFAIHFFLHFNGFFHNFPPFSSIVPPVFNDVPSFSLVFSYLFPSVFKGPKENRTPPSPNCLVVHAPLKNSNWLPLSSPNIELSVHLGNLAKTTLPSLSAGFRNWNLCRCSSARSANRACAKMFSWSQARAPSSNTYFQRPGLITVPGGATTLTSRTAIPNTVISTTMGYFSHSR